MHNEDVAPMLRKLRIDAGLTQVALAAKVDRTQSWVSGIESGGHLPDYTDLDAWVRACKHQVALWVEPDGESDDTRSSLMSALAGLKRDQLLALVRITRSLPLAPPSMVEAFAAALDALAAERMRHKA